MGRLATVVVMKMESLAATPFAVRCTRTDASPANTIAAVPALAPPLRLPLIHPPTPTSPKGPAIDGGLPATTAPLRRCEPQTTAVPSPAPVGVQSPHAKGSSPPSVALNPFSASKTPVATAV